MCFEMTFIIKARFCFVWYDLHLFGMYISFENGKDLKFRQSFSEVLWLMNDHFQFNFKSFPRAMGYLFAIIIYKDRRININQIFLFSVGWTCFDFYGYQTNCRFPGTNALQTKIQSSCNSWWKNSGCQR